MTYQIDGELFGKLLSPKSTSLLRVYIFIIEQLKTSTSNSKYISIREIANNCHISDVTASKCVGRLKVNRVFEIVAMRNPNRPNLFKLNTTIQLPQRGEVDEGSTAFNKWLATVGQEMFRELRAMYGMADVQTMRRHFDNVIAKRPKIQTPI